MSLLLAAAVVVEGVKEIAKAAVMEVVKVAAGVLAKVKFRVSAFSFFR